MIGEDKDKNETDGLCSLKYLFMQYCMNAKYISFMNEQLPQLKSSATKPDAINLKFTHRICMISK